MRSPLWIVSTLALCAVGAFCAQKQKGDGSPKAWAEYPGQSPTNLPPDYQVPHEWVWTRLMYTSNPNRRGGFGGGGFGGGRRGGGGGGFGGRFQAWATDYPKGDRILVRGLRRLTSIDTRSVEQPISLDGSDDVYNWPFLYAVEVGQWELDDDEAKQLRDFIDRGGFFMVDDFHGEQEWDLFMASFEKVFQPEQVIDIPDSDPINRIMFDLGGREQVPGAQYMRSGTTWERADGHVPHWRGVYDAKKRLVAVMAHNSDLGDAFEFADDPNYPERFSQAAFRLVSNYALYDLTH